MCFPSARTAISVIRFGRRRTFQDGGRRVPWPMLADPGGRIGSAYGVYDEVGGVNIRGRFLIDPDGVIQAMEVMTPPVGRNILEMIRQVKAYQHVRATGEVMPAGWEPGKPRSSPALIW